MQIVYDRVRSLAKEKNISLIQLCEEIGVSKNTINNWKNKYPNTDSLIAVATFFQVSADYLLGLTDHRQPLPESQNLPPNMLDLLHYLSQSNFSNHQAAAILHTIQDMLAFQEDL